MAKIFIDTNILIYTLDKQDRVKHKKARNIMRKLIKDNQAVLSTQVLQEFYSVATTKKKLNKVKAKSIVNGFRPLEIVNIDVDLIDRAIDINVFSQISFWDSLIVAAAEFAGCDEIYSEDLQSGQKIRGIKIVNPFRN